MNAQSIKGEREASEKANREPIKLAEPSTKGLSVESARLQGENEELRKKLAELGSGKKSLSTESERVKRENKALKKKLAELSLVKDVPSFKGVTIINEVSDSGQSKVYKGKYKGMDVAVKVFKAPMQGDYRDELDSLLKLHHPNVVSLITCFDSPSPCIVTLFMPNGDLCKFLENNGAQSKKNATRLSLGIAKGLAYIHEKKLIHRDLKSPNVLLDDHLNPVIVDFGLTHFSTRSLTTVTSTVGTFQWMAPEMFNSGSKYSSKVDVYAFGIILWELLSGQVPYSTLRNLEELIRHVVSGNRLTINPKWDSTLAKLCVKCWQQSYDSRPTMSDVVSILSGE